MLNEPPERRVHQRLINSLYTESVVLADEARSYFDGYGSLERAALPQLARVTFSCESLKVTTRLMHSIGWLLTWRAVLSGELSKREALDPSRRLGEAPVSEPKVVADLPATAVELINASGRFHDRIARLDQAQAASAASTNAVRSLHERLVSAL